MKATPKTLTQALGLVAFSAFLATKSIAGGIVEPGKANSPARANLEANQAKAETTAGKARMAEISQKLNIPTAELITFFKEELAAGRGSKRAWSELMVFVTTKPRNGATQADFQHITLASEALSSYITIRSSKMVDNFSIREADLVEVQKSWTLEQKTNFNKVLRRTAELVKARRHNTLEENFNQALEDTGYATAYRSCRI